VPNSTSQIQQQYEGTRLAAAAYGAEQFKALLATNPSSGALTAGVESILMQQGFSPGQASSFIAKYTPVAALDQDGAGAVLFKVNGTDQIATVVRGTDQDNNFKNDLVLADSSRQTSTTVGVGDAKLKSLGTTPIASAAAACSNSSVNNAASTRIEGNARVLSDEHTQAPGTQTNAQTIVTAGDSRINSNAATVAVATNDETYSSVA
jgi:hypothetical protein